MFKGVLTALVTPFQGADQNLHEAAWADLIEWQIESGVGGLVVFGTTGESATLDSDEKLWLAQSAVRIANGRVPIIAGSGSNNTAASISLTKALRDVGVDGVLAVTPYYNKPSQEGVYQHFSAIAELGGLPLILYNIPGRTNIKIEMETFSRLAKIENIAGVKQAVDSASELVELAGVLEGSNISIFAGDDPLVFSVMSVGGKGVISASANVIPEKFVELVSSAEQGDLARALKIQQDILPIIRTLFLETNPAPVKAALELIGKIPNASLRLPLVEASSSTRDELKKVLNLS